MPCSVLGAIDIRGRGGAGRPHPQDLLDGTEGERQRTQVVDGRRAVAEDGVDLGADGGERLGVATQLEHEPARRAGGGVEAGGHEAAHLVEQLGVGERLAVDADEQGAEGVGVSVGVDPRGSPTGDLGQHQLVGGAVVALHAGVRVDRAGRARSEPAASAARTATPARGDRRTGRRRSRAPPRRAPAPRCGGPRHAAMRWRRAACRAARRRARGRPRARRARGGRRPA